MLRRLPTNVIRITTEQLNVIARETAELMHYSAMGSRAIGEQLMSKFAASMPEISREMCEIAIEDSSYLFTGQLFAKHGLIPNQRAQETVRLAYMDKMTSRFNEIPEPFERYKAIEAAVADMTSLLNEPQWQTLMSNTALQRAVRTEYHVCESSKGLCVVALTQTPNEPLPALQAKLDKMVGEPVTRLTSTLSADEISGFLQVPITDKINHVYFKNEGPTLTVNM